VHRIGDGQVDSRRRIGAKIFAVSYWLSANIDDINRVCVPSLIGFVIAFSFHSCSYSSSYFRRPENSYNYCQITALHLQSEMNSVQLFDLIESSWLCHWIVFFIDESPTTKLCIANNTKSWSMADLQNKFNLFLPVQRAVALIFVVADSVQKAISFDSVRADSANFGRSLESKNVANFLRSTVRYDTRCYFNVRSSIFVYF